MQVQDHVEYHRDILVDVVQDVSPPYSLLRPAPVGHRVGQKRKNDRCHNYLKKNSITSQYSESLQVLLVANYLTRADRLQNCKHEDEADHVEEENGAK